MVDAILVERACKGDGEAFGEIYGQVYENCVKYIRGMCKDETLAEQVVQDTVLHFIEDDYRVLKNLQDFSKFESYFFSAATNRFRNIYKRGKTQDGDVREVFVDEIYDVNEDARLDRYFGVSESMTPEELLEHQELKEILMSMVDELPESQREVVYLHYFNEWKQREVAEYFEANLNTIKSTLQRAKESLYKKVETYEKKTGTKLHSVVPILPFLRLIYASEEIARPDLSVLLASAGTTAAGTAGIGAAAAASAGSGTAVATTAGVGTATSATAVAGVAAKVGGGLVTKVVAGVLAAAVVGTGAIVVPKLVDDTPVNEPAINETAIIQPEDHIGEIDLSWLDEDLRPAVTSIEVDPDLGAEVVQFIKDRYAEMETILQKDYAVVQDEYGAWYESSDGYQKSIIGDPSGDYGSISIYKETEEYYTETEGNLVSHSYTNTYVSGELDRFRYRYEYVGQAVFSSAEEYMGDIKINVDSIECYYFPDSDIYDTYAYGISEYPDAIGAPNTFYNFFKGGSVLGVVINQYTNFGSAQVVVFSYSPISRGKTTCVLSQIAIIEDGRRTEYAVDGTVKSVHDISEFAVQ